MRSLAVRPLVLLPLLLAACDSGTAPSVPTTVTATSPLAQTAVASSPVASPPAVRVVDQRGQAMAGVAVTFAVTAGGGSLGSAAATTDAAGNASAGTWTLGSAGPQAVTATVASLPPVQFTATAQARVATTLVPVSATSQSAAAGTAVQDPPAVRVDDQTGQPLPGAQVVFAVTGGGGTLVGATATADAAGVARVGSWTLGAAAGPNTVTASAGNAAPVQFTATGTAAANPCATAAAYTLFSTVSGTLAQTDCNAGGHFVDLYQTALSQQTGATYRMTSQAVDAWLEIYDGSGNIVAANDDDDAASPTTDSAIRLFAPAGSYFLAATSYAPGETGSYQLSSSALAENAGCLDAWVVRGVTVAGTLASGDCVYGGYLADDYLVVLRAGQTLQVRLASTSFDAYLELYSATGDLLAEDDDSAGGTDALLTYTATEHSVFILAATTFDQGESGAYTMAVSSGFGGELPPVIAPGSTPRVGSRLVPRAKPDAAALRTAREHPSRPAKAPR